LRSRWSVTSTSPETGSNRSSSFHPEPAEAPYGAVGCRLEVPTYGEFESRERLAGLRVELEELAPGRQPGGKRVSDPPAIQAAVTRRKRDILESAIHTTASSHIVKDD
jgi:hypothetical protein